MARHIAPCFIQRIIVVNEHEPGPTVPRLPTAQPLAEDTKPRGGSGTPDLNRTADHVNAPATDDTANSTSAGRARGGTEGQAGTSIVPGYVLLRELGRGGMGVVFEARHVKLNRVVALKMMLGGEQVGKGELLRFLAEAEAVAAVRHSNVVQVYDYGEANGHPFMALEYCPGGTLGADLKQRNPRATTPELRGAVELLTQVARGVAAAHAQGIVHRDLKPGNVFLDADGVPKVADFGLAKRGEGTDVTRTVQVMGTPAYMSPEQAKGATKFVGPQADVWALGVMLYEALAGTRPFAGTVHEVLAQVQNADPVPPRKVVPSVPRDLELICMHCLTKAAHERYPTAKELADDLDRYLQHKPISVRPAGPVERAVKWVRRNRVISAAAATVFVALVLGAGVSFAYMVKAENKAIEAKRKQQEADDAGIAKDIAIGEKDTALGQKDTALGEKDAALDLAGRNGYRSTVALGFSEWGQGNLVQARQKLAECPPKYREWEAHLLDRLCNKDVKRWPGQPMMITAAAISPDGTRLVAATRDDSIHVWDRHTGKRLQTNRGHLNLINSIAVSPDGTLFASTSPEANLERGDVVVWELATGHMLQRMSGHDGFFHGLCFSPDSKHLAVGASKGVVSIWNPRTGELVKTIKGHTGTGRSVQYSADAKYLCWTCRDETVELWEVAGARRVCRFVPPKPEAQAAGGSFSPDGKYLAVGWGLLTGRGQVGLWELSNTLEGDLTEPHQRLPEYASPVHVVAWSGDSRLLAAGDAAGAVNVWDVTASNSLGRMEAHALAVTSLSFEKNGHGMVSASADGRVRVWDAPTGKPAGEVVASHVPVRCVAVSPDGKQVAAGSSSVGPATGILIRDFESGQVVHGLYGHKNSIRALTYSGDGNRLASVSSDRMVMVWDPKTGKRLKTFTVGPALPISVALDHNGERLLVTDSSGTVRLWSYAESRFIGSWQALVNSSVGGFGVALEPKGTRFATITSDGLSNGLVKVWDPARTEPLLTLKQNKSAQPEANGPTVAWSPDGLKIAAVGREANSGETKIENIKSEVTIWNVNTKAGRPARRLSAPPGIQSVSFAADSAALVMSCTNGRVFYWDLTTGAAFPLAGHVRSANGAVVHPDGRHIISCGEDSTIRVWHRFQSRDALTFPLISHVATIDPDGRLLASAGNGAVTIWDLNTGEKVVQYPSGPSWHVSAMSLRPGRRLVTVAPEFIKGELETKSPRLEVAVRPLDLPDQVSREVLNGHSGTLSPDGRVLTYRTRENLIQVYDIDARKVICDLPHPPDRWPMFVFSNDGTRLAVTSRLNATVYELPSGRPIYELRGHSTDVASIAFSNDGRWIATGTNTGPNFQHAPGLIYLWDAASGRRVRVMSGHKLSIQKLTFSNDGKRLVSAGEDGTLRIWDTVRGEEALRFPIAYRDPGTALAFDRTGRLMVAELDAVRVWDGRPITERLPDFGE
jgi:WD40 repeat protein